MAARSAVSRSWAADSVAVPAARRMVREYVVQHDLEALLDAAELVVTELVTNVVLHVGGSLEVSAAAGDDGELLIEVSDSSPVFPLLRAFSATSSTGRGMRLVHSMAAAHGVRSREDGKTLWVRLTAAASDQSDDDLTTAFADVDWLAGIEDVADPDGGRPEDGSAHAGRPRDRAARRAAPLATLLREAA